MPSPDLLSNLQQTLNVLAAKTVDKKEIGRSLMGELFPTILSNDNSFAVRRIACNIVVLLMTRCAENRSLILDKHRTSLRSLAKILSETEDALFQLQILGVFFRCTPKSLKDRSRFISEMGLPEYFTDIKPKSFVHDARVFLSTLNKSKKYPVSIKISSARQQVQRGATLISAHVGSSGSDDQLEFEGDEMWLDLNPESLSATLTMIHTGEYCEYHISYSKISAWRCGKEGDGFQVTFEFDETPERMSSQATDGLHQQQRSMERSMMMFRVVSFRASGVLEEILNGKGVKRARKMSVPAVLFLTAGSKRRIHEVEDDDTGCTRHQSSPDEPAYAPHESSPDDTGFAPPQSSPDDGHKSDSPIPSLAPSITRSSSSSLGTMNFSLSPINSTIPHVNQLTVRSSSPATPSTLQSLIRSGLGPVVKRQRRGIESLDLNAAGQVSIPVVRRKKVGFVDHVKASSSSSLGQSDGYLLRKDQRTEIAVNGALVSIFTAAAKQMEEKLNKLGENVLAKVDESINEKEEIIGKLFGGLIQQCENLCCQEEDEMSM